MQASQGVGAQNGQARPFGQALPLGQAAAPRGDAIQSVGFFFVCVLLFLLFSRVQEQIPLLTKMSSVFVAGLLAMGAGLMTGGVYYVVRARQGIYLLSFTCWLVLATITSNWKSGSLALLTDMWVKSLWAFLAVGAGIATLRQCKNAMYVMGVSLFVVEVITTLVGRDEYGRLGVGDVGTLANANVLAFHIVFLFPCLLLAMLHAGRVWKLLAIPVMIYGIFLVLQTGSRGGLIEIALVSLFIFIRLGAGQKIVFTVVALAAVSVGVGMASKDALARYRTLFTDEIDSSSFVSATASQMQRKYLLEQSLQMTFQHPLLGVGPGVFLSTLAGEEAKDGRASAWRNTHNAYTQLSSETGLPGFLLFMAALLSCMGLNFRTYRKYRGRVETQDRSDVAYGLLIMLAIWTANGPFDSNAYQYYMPVLVGLTVALARAGQTSPVAAPVPMFRQSWAVPLPVMAGAESKAISPSQNTTPKTPQVKSPGLKMTRYSVRPGDRRGEG